MNPIDEVQEEAARKFDPREADALYKPFPSFAEWSAKCVVDLQRWEPYAENIDKLRSDSPDLLPRALEVVKRAAAWDTGAIEGLYETDRGFTLTVAMEVATLETLAEQKGEKARELFESQLKAYNYVLDFATQRIPIAEAWIRRLHAVVCESQNTYEVQTSIGKQHQPLPKGEYKRNPNHVVQRDGSIHSWSPVDLTPAEMHRLCEELRTEAFKAGHPIMQAAYAHYAFVSVHPFADGNGRVARALASVFTYRAESIPLLILKGDIAYLPALETADDGDFQRFVDFILEKTIDAVRMVEVAFGAAGAPSIEDSLDRLKQSYLTREGYTDAQVDELGSTLFDLFVRELTRQYKQVPGGSMLTIESRAQSEHHNPSLEGYRSPNTRSPRTWSLILTAALPCTASVARAFQLEVPQDCGQNEEVVIRGLNINERFAARISELISEPTPMLQLRLSLWCEKILRDALDELTRTAVPSLRKEP